MILQEKSYIHGTRGHCRLDDWHESVRRAAVVAVAKIAAGGSQKTNRAEQRQRQQRHVMACWKGWVIGSLFVFDSFVATFKFLNAGLCVCVVQCCSPVNLWILWWPRRRAISTALSWRRLHVMTGAYHCRFFVSLVGCVASTAGQQLLRHVGQWTGWHAQVVDCAEGADWVARWQKILFLHMIYSVQT